MAKIHELSEILANQIAAGMELKLKMLKQPSNVMQQVRLSTEKTCLKFIHWVLEEKLYQVLLLFQMW